MNAHSDDFDMADDLRDMSQVYRDAARHEDDQGPSPEIDAAILAAAHRAVASRPQAVPAWQPLLLTRWRLPLAIAASFLVGVFVTFSPPQTAKAPQPDAGSTVVGQSAKSPPVAVASPLERDQAGIPAPASSDTDETKMIMRGAKTEKDYQVRLKKIADKQAEIDPVLAFITSTNYKDFPDVVAMVEGVFEQAGKISDAKAKHEAAAAKKDWENAHLWAWVVWQHYVKVADLSLRAKAYLEQNGARKIK
jgi:hypothetical protein